MLHNTPSASDCNRIQLYYIIIVLGVGFNVCAWVLEVYTQCIVYYTCTCLCSRTNRALASVLEHSAMRKSHLYVALDVCSIRDIP